MREMKTTATNAKVDRYATEFCSPGRCLVSSGGPEVFFIWNHSFSSDDWENIPRYSTDLWLQGFVALWLGFVVSWIRSTSLHLAPPRSAVLEMEVSVTKNSTIRFNFRCSWIPIGCHQLLSVQFTSLETTAFHGIRRPLATFGKQFFTLCKSLGTKLLQD
ncbi:Protein of unknown function [Pyronema omphalodes CBS 100304]|uniref:Uncharacterized protein n=1 Tax=Pyronema omphalodes (strain CBS 100304) TaxID=1076935 RepID=U4L9U7_PYROM|nr:Protein of unknown function [Pyronema omphalodes CBS 100304]